MGATVLTAMSPVATTSGTFVDSGTIPTWAKRISILFNGVSSNGTVDWQLQLGLGATIYNTGYNSVVQNQNGSSTSGSTIGFIVTLSNAITDLYYGQVVLTNYSGFNWSVAGMLTGGTTNQQFRYMAGIATVTGLVDKVRLTTTAGVNTFDAGSISIVYE